jgi:hypothetical protein
VVGVQFRWHQEYIQCQGGKERMCNYAFKSAHKHLNHLGEAAHALSDSELRLPSPAQNQAVDPDHAAHVAGFGCPRVG